MLRKLREQWWYTLLWLPLSTALGLLAVWLWIIFRVIGMWTIHYNAAPKWGFLSIGALALFVLFLVLLFPRKPARDIKVVAVSVSLVALFLCILFYANTRVVSFEVRDVDGGPLEGIPIHLTHSAGTVALTWFPGDAVLHTNKQGNATIRIFKSEQCEANINYLLGEDRGHGNSNYSEDNAFFMPMSAQARMDNWSLSRHDLVEHTYMLQFQGALSYISQRCLESPLNSDSAVVHVYLRRNDSSTLPPYFDQIIDQVAADPDLKRVRLMSLGGSIESFNHLDELLSAFSHDDSLEDAALISWGHLALQIGEISSNLSRLSWDVNIPQRRDRYSYDQSQKCSQILYVWLSGSKSPPPLSHIDRIAYIRQRMDQATLKLIDALHPMMLKKKLAYRVLEQLQQNARPAMKYYPEVLEKGTDEAKEGALESIIQIAPSAQDVAFLIRSKRPAWIDCASRISFNSTAAELSDDLKSLKSQKAQESDAQNNAAFEQVIRLVSHQLTEDQEREANLPSSTVEPRYVVIDLGTKMLHPKKITNSGYVLGREVSSYYVWFDGTATALQPRNEGDMLTVDDIDESGTVVGSEMTPRLSKGTHPAVNLVIWEKGANPPKPTAESASSLGEEKPGIQEQICTLNLPQIANTPIVPQAMNAAMAPPPAHGKPPADSARFVTATQVIGNGPSGGYIWEMTPTLSATKSFEGPYLINLLLPGEPKTSPWNVMSVASINDGGSIVGTAIYKPKGPNDPIAAGPHGVMLMPLAIVRESPPGSGDYEPILDNGLDDNAELPIFTSAPPGTPNSSNPETDGQGIFYIQFPGSIASSITLKSGDNRVTVQATPVKEQPNLLRTGKLVLIGYRDSFKAPDITTLEVGPSSKDPNPSVQLQKYEQTIVW